MRVVAAFVLLCGILVLAGCGGAEDASQRVAREAVEGLRPPPLLDRDLAERLELRPRSERDG